MYTADELGGLNAMMPAFATDDATDIEATNTVDVDRLTDAVDRIIKDGADVISTGGSYGECHTLLWEEFQTLVTATLEVVNNRVPVFIGITSLNSREVVQKARFAREAGAQGIFTGVPFYYESTVKNAVRFYHDLAELFPDLSIQIYSNPELHKIRIPVAAFHELIKEPSIVSMKETSSRGVVDFQRVMDVIEGKISVFAPQHLYFPYKLLGARGFWSTSAFQGPWPLVMLRDVVDAGDYEEARAILRDIAPGGGGGADSGATDYARKVANKYSGYCDLGPNRPPFMEISEQSMAAAIKSAERWKDLCDKYRPLVEAKTAATVR